MEENPYGPPFPITIFVIVFIISFFIWVFAS